MVTQEQFIRNFSAMANGEVDFFLGAGASIASGVPTGEDLIWEFKRKIYCSENGVSTEKFKDLTLPSTRKMFQEYFDQKGFYPQQYAPEEYSSFFEKCYSDPLARKRFIERIVSNRESSIGYQCLAEAVVNGKVKNVWTTNFDSLLEDAVNRLYPTNNVLVCSEANRDSIHMLNPAYPVIGKLHGDYRYDWLKNTESELQQLEEKIKEYVASQLVDKQLMVVGYSGNDESIMSFLEECVENPASLSKGLLWAVLKGCQVNQRVAALVKNARNNGKYADIVEIDGFEQLMYSMYQIQNYHNEDIDDQGTSFRIKDEVRFSGQAIDSFIKLNAYKSEGYPRCNVFETDITSWSEFRAVIAGTDIIAGLFDKHIYAFSSDDKLKKIFGDHVLSPIIKTEASEKDIHRDNSVYIGLIYQLIERALLSKGMKSCGKYKVYNPSSKKTDHGFQVYDALQIAVSYLSQSLFLNFLPTVYVRGRNGELLDKETNKIQMNRIVSGIYNREYNDNLRFWEELCLHSGEFTFENDGFRISFGFPAISLGGSERKPRWLTLPAYKYDEPLMCFSDSDQSKRRINQLKGLCQFGPIDYSYIKRDSVRPAVKLAVLSPNRDMDVVLTHLNALNTLVANSGKDKFLPHYEGFEKVYRRSLFVPAKGQKNICIGYGEKVALRMKPAEFLEFMKRGIQKFSLYASDFDVLVIYIPKDFELFRTSEEISPDFNLHDALKLYAIEKGIKLQLIEEKSIYNDDKCKVMWGLSTSLYAKATGVLWHPEAIRNDTAYIGVSYAYSEEKRTCIGCSQLFDSTGTGIKMVMRKIDNPIIYGKNNPFMTEDDARTLMIELREQYNRSAPVNTLKRIVVHKTTPFIREEISGIRQAFRGVEIDLLQIQEYCPWRGILIGEEPSKKAQGFPVKRGLAVKLDRDSFLLWTHGCIIHPELSGKWNYFKGSRGIPSPLLVRRYMGKASGDVLAREILMLTKMNWNSGDSLYKTLPVTLDFAKILARMSKQDEAIFDKAYDFRFFM